MNTEQNTELNIRAQLAQRSRKQGENYHNVWELV